MAFDPSGIEQEFMQITNRFRSDPTGEFSRLMISASPTKARDPQIDAMLQYFGVNGVAFQQELSTLTPQPPTAWSEPIYNAATAHNNLLVQANQQSHQLPGEPRLRDRLQAAGFVGGALGENVYGYGRSVLYSFAAYVTDWGPGTFGMQDGRAHRVNLMNARYNRAGVAFATGPGSGDGANIGPFINTQDFGELLNAPAMIVGAVFQDRNGSGWYESGEGIGAVQITFEGPAGTFNTSAMTAGGYQLELPAGTYRATASGGGLASPVVIPNVQIGSQNVWLNIIYDPNVIPLDRLEFNNSLATATLLSAADQTLSALNINTPGDYDYFRVVPNSTGSLHISLQHSSAAGNLDLLLFNSAGGVIASSSTAADVESIDFTVARGATHYVLVMSAASAANRAYQLQVDVPEPKPPQAMRDVASIESNAPAIDLPVLANDSDPDGAIGSVQISVLAGSGNFTVGSGAVKYTAPAGYWGIDRATYRITDDQNLVSTPTEIQVFVIDFARQKPFQNSRNFLDTSDDGVVSALDALLIITEINTRSARQLPTSFAGTAGLFGFLDTNGDGFLTALDSLLVINEINTRGSADGELAARSAAQSTEMSMVTSAQHALSVDAAFAQYSAGYSTWDQDRKKRSIVEHVVLNCSLERPL